VNLANASASRNGVNLTVSIPVGFKGAFTDAESGRGAGADGPKGVWEAEQFTWAEEERFRERTSVERVYARLKDEFGGAHIRVRGAQKVMAHLMFGVLALTAEQLLRM
jgi:hypothetical protein